MAPPLPWFPPESRVNIQECWGRDRPIWCGYIMVEPQTPLGVLHKFISYIYEVLFHLDKLWIGIWHQPEPDSPLSRGVIFRNLGVGTDLSDEVTSWLSPKPHLECFTNSNDIESISDKVGTDQSDVVTSWLSHKPHLECFTNSYHIYMNYFFTLINCGSVYNTNLSLIPPWVEVSLSGMLG
jgi:hypothetical protein